MRMAGQTQFRRVLVVDDEYAVRETIQIALEDRGFEVRKAADGLEALAILREWPCGLVLTDLRMPHMDGTAFLVRLRAEGNTVPVVVLSGFTEQLTEAMGATLGVSKVLPKPFGIATLLATVDSVMTEREAGT